MQLQMALALLNNLVTRKNDPRGPLPFIGVMTVSDNAASMQIIETQQHMKELLANIPELNRFTLLHEYLKGVQGATGLRGLRVCSIIVHNDGRSGSDVYVMPQEIQLSQAISEASRDPRFSMYVPTLTKLAERVDMKRARPGHLNVLLNAITKTENV
jgi:hypothetical protein